MTKKSIRVYILASPHPQFDEIIDFPPKGVKYEINRIKSQYHGWFTEKKIAIHGMILKFLPLPRMIHSKTNADIVHSTRGIIQIFQEKPWIIDLESGGVFTSFNYGAMQNPITKRIIMASLSSKNCKKILPQSEAARKDFEKVLGKDYEKIKNKVEVLYLAMRPCEKKRIKHGKKFIISFIGKEFYSKGGQDVLRAYEILSGKYKNLELRFKSDIPEEYRNLKLHGLKIIEGHFPREKLFDMMYLEADAFVLPTTSDNFGVVYLEAMSAGLPVIGTTSFTVPEIIEDGKNGFVIKSRYSWENYFTAGKNLDMKKYSRDTKREHPEIIRQIVDKVSYLIENPKTAEKMGREGRKMIEDGKFSIKERNKKLSRIYEEALKK
jgi:glycosyltransferase involved in cell wall biosynthesis